MVEIILDDGEYFGTDGADFDSNGEGMFITKGNLYAISQGQYDPSLGDITRGEALRLLNVSSK